MAYLQQTPPSSFYSCNRACGRTVTICLHGAANWVNTPSPPLGGSWERSEPASPDGLPTATGAPEAAPGERRLWQAHTPFSQMLSNDNSKISSDFPLL